MDIAQIFGDYIHLLGMIIMFAKLWFTKSCAGISGKTQLLYAMVFTARFSDLTIRYVSLYNTILKIIYISITYCIVLSIYILFKKTYDRKRDAFRIDLLILPCAVFSLFLNEAFETVEVFYAFSVFLESVAIVPQVYLVSKSKEVEAIVVSYVSCLGLYRGCYIMHWLYAYFRRGHLDRITVAGGIVQLLFYCDFLARNLPILKSKGAGRRPVVLPLVGAADETRHGRRAAVVLVGGESAAAAGGKLEQLVSDVQEAERAPGGACVGSEGIGGCEIEKGVPQREVVLLPTTLAIAEEKVTLLMDKE